MNSALALLLAGLATARIYMPAIPRIERVVISDFWIRSMAKITLVESTGFNLTGDANVTVSCRFRTPLPMEIPTPVIKCMKSPEKHEENKYHFSVDFGTQGNDTGILLRVYHEVDEEYATWGEARCPLLCRPSKKFKVLSRCEQNADTAMFLDRMKPRREDPDEPKPRQKQKQKQNHTHTHTHEQKQTHTLTHTQLDKVLHSSVSNVP